MHKLISVDCEWRWDIKMEQEEGVGMHELNDI